ncbi:RsmF rRNA methyltransferase first C-terminal domain-containing protein [Vallitalea guaymasensis]|uniref:RsmF rRNA methyltransferase first C-terminal domain-containing protein n=1 Tax=Vallitalea guaymasensis TaxID=1185412 RepID=UPI002353B856|nr:RsmB/NOP family class I SAM-dependent RNA methyltransferase [Vallitalea guaymasensis]
MNLPDKYIAKMKGLLKDEYEEYIESFNEERLHGLRVNNLKIDTEEFGKIAPFHLDKIHWISNGYYYAKEDLPSKHPYYYAGLYYLQEPSAMTPAELFGIEPYDKVLDLCAAPGGKSTELGAKLKGTGVLVSNDISASRAKSLLKNIELAGISNSIVLSETPEKLSNYFPEYFDKILIDAPCSGEGMFRKDNSMIKNWSEESVDYYSDIQNGILPYAAEMLKPGGYMMYSTCTFSPSENEKTISKFLDEHEDFELANLPDFDGFDRGKTEWSSSDKYDLSKTVRLWPHKIKGEGHFVALLYKKESETTKRFKKYKMDTREKEYSVFVDFEKEYLNVKFDRSRLQVINEKLYYMPKEIPVLKGLRLLRTGLYMGDIKKNRFEPSQAFACSLTREQFKNIVNLDIMDDNVIRYLKGETLQVEGAKGWNLVCTQNYPLGFAKKANNLLKNKYYPGWRYM